MNTTVIPPLQIRFFGPFEVLVHGSPLPRLRSRKGHWLLALLALRPDQEVERSWLAATLWPEAEEALALVSLRQSLTDLRAALGPEARRLTSPRMQTLLFQCEGVESDLMRFKAALARKNVTGWEEAIALYRGRLLEGCIEEWAELERTSLHENYLTALEDLAASQLNAGDLVTAIGTLQQAIAADPLRENLYRHLMRALAANHDYAAATCVYRDLRLLLRDQFHAEPEPETLALFQRLRNEAHQQTEVTPRSIPDTQSPPLFAEPGSETSHDNRLQRPINRLLGREADALDVQVCLQSVRLVTLTGAGGIGKTRLAIQVGEDAQTDYPEGVNFVDLASLTEPGLVGATVAKALGIQEQAEHTILDTMQEELAPRHMLLILDNCEHLIEACGQLSEALLHACPRLHILATSQQEMGLLGETVWRVPPLGLPTQQEAEQRQSDPEPLMAFAAIRLFVERGMAASPRFALTSANAAAVVQVCRRLEGIPLALEMAAARLNVLTVEQIATRLDDRFRLLTGGSRTAIPRQQTLRAAMDWSYDLLSPAEQIALQRLSIFAGGATLEAIETVCSDDPSQLTDATNHLLTAMGRNVQAPATQIACDALLEYMSQLVAKSFVWVDTYGEETRYRLSETTRAYAWGRLEARGEADIISLRLVDYFFQRFAARQDTYPGNLQRWYDWLESEHDNLRLILKWLTRPNIATETHYLALQLISDILGPFWIQRGYLSEGRSWAEKALAVCDVTTVVRANVEMFAGSQALAQNAIDKARAHYDMALSIYQREHCEDAMTRAMNGLGKAAYYDEDWPTARRFFNECLSRSQALNNPMGVAGAYNNLGVLAFAQGDYVAARPYHEQCIAINRLENNVTGIAWSLDNLAETYQAEGDLVEARCHFLESLTLFQQVGHRQGVADCLAGLAEVLQDLSASANVPAAVQLYGAAERIRESVGLALTRSDRKEYERRTQLLRESLGEADFLTLWQQGRTLPLDKVIALAESGVLSPESA
ncbi:MAG TPA: BTAD domain-containing putative transcriptional regulator [Chthonomonadaceae bacterium]|nr:BTAD domain-containing putative transcriptional regulator [Chthonomonadaceae bacterium]